MNDLISRQAAIAAIMDECITANMDSVHDSELHRCKRATHRILAKLPTIDLVKRGKWELHEYPDGYYHTECSECGKVYDEKVYFWTTAHYCPNCGAKMEEVR